jgi:hypothetical protein
MAQLSQCRQSPVAAGKDTQEDQHTLDTGQPRAHRTVSLLRQIAEGLRVNTWLFIV